METKTNYLALIVCPFVNMALGMTWYGVFATQWMSGHGLTQERVESMPNGAMPYITSFVGSLATAFVLNIVFKRMGVNTWADGAKSGAAFGFFGLVGMIINNMFSLKPFELSLIDGGFAFVLFILYGTIVGGWQKK